MEKDLLKQLYFNLKKRTVCRFCGDAVAGLTGLEPPRQQSLASCPHRPFGCSGPNWPPPTPSDLSPPAGRGALPRSSAQRFPHCECGRGPSGADGFTLRLFLQGDGSLSATTFDSDSDTKAKKKSFHKPPPTSLKSPYHSKPRKVASWRSLRTAVSMPLGGRMSLTPQKLCLGSSKQGYVPGNPIYREKEDMYDEIIELKKSLNVQKSDVDLMRTKLRRLEEENSRKDRQIEQLLDASRGPDFVRTLAEKRPDTGWVISGLKQRVLRLEQQCKEKDSAISKLQTDVKTTNLEEMRVAMETYYEEIHRLHSLLASSETTGRRPPVEKKIGLKRQKKMSSALLSLSRSVQELTEENQSLKEDLDRMLSNSPTASKIKGYADWSKPRLVRRITELEKKLSSMESPKPQASEAARPASPTPSAPSPASHLQESERLRGAVRSLQDERSALHAQLQERDLEVKQLLQTKAELEKELENVKEGERQRREREKVLREEIQELTRKFRELEGRKREEEDEPAAAAPETHEEPSQPPSPTASPSQPDTEPDWSQGGSSRPPSTCSEGRRDEAARVLQRRWKGYQRQKERALLDEHSLSTLVRTSVLRPQAEGPRNTDRKAGQSRLEGGCRAAGGFPGASSSGEAAVQHSVCLGTPQGAEPSHPGLARAPHPEPRCPGRGRPVARGGHHHHPVCLPGTPGTGQAQCPRSRSQHCRGSRQAGLAAPQGPLPSTPPCGRSWARRQRGEQRGDRQGASSRGRSAEAATLLRLNIWKFTFHVLLKPGLENLQPSRANTQKRCPFHYRGLECKSRKSRDNRQIWPWSTE
ncbi:IQ domain-containing protein E isoform X2 [Ovis aries]|uniref:IQ domain-containing protein E isoform X2 n=1 Tax=Ovis aries TaxID=9940 RepID=UPI002952869F|nr:IQ domain-containing protein E isoform X2 [Ovis aries]